MRFMTKRDADQRYKIGTWGFLGFGWWVSHIVSIAAVGYVGYLLRKMGR